MGARAWMVAVTLGLAVAPVAAKPKGGDPKPTRVDITSFKDRLVVLRDAAGGTYVVLDPMASEYRVWYGVGKTLYEQSKQGRSADGASWSLSLWAPTLEQLRPGTIDKQKDGTYRKTCDHKDDGVLTELTGAAGQAVLDGSALMTPMLIRRAHLLARDDRGIYYYVDRLVRNHGGKGYRVFVGKKGAMRPLPLVDVASDSGGQVFATKKGDLRLVANGDATIISKAIWIRGRRRSELVSLDVEMNSALIFGELGVYGVLGTICDNV